MAKSKGLTNAQLEELNTGVCIVMATVIATLPPEQKSMTIALLQRMADAEPSGLTVPATVVLQQVEVLEIAISKFADQQSESSG